MKKAAIIIVNWNGLKFLKNCLSSVYKQTYKDFDVYFVDNGSIDESVNFVKNNFAKAKIIQLDKNYGFAKGNNEGIREAFKDKKVEYIVCLNNDTIVDKNWLKELVKTAEKHDNVGSVQSKVLLSDKKKIHNLGMRFIKNLQGDENGNIILGYGEQSKKYKEEFEIFCSCATSVLYRKDALKRVGLFDESFFAYNEDLDLGWRINKAGYKSWCNPNSSIVHFHSQTVGRASPFKAYYIRRNLYLTAIKNFNILNLILFPLRDFIYNINLILNNNAHSLAHLSSKIGKLKILALNIKVFLSIIYNCPIILLKRLKC